jgi:hypothetical protein
MLKRFTLAAVAAICLSSVGAFAQAATPTQSSPSRLDASQLVATSATSAATLTITPPSGQYVYINGVEVQNCAGGTAVTAAAPTTVTTTNLGGVAWTIGSGVTAGLCQPSPMSAGWAAPLKSAAPGTAVTIVLPTFATNQTIRVSAYYYFAP